jgi:ribosomal protein L19
MSFLSDIKLNKYNYYNNYSLVKKNYLRVGSQLEVEFLIPEFYKLNKLKKSKSRRQTSYGDLRFNNFQGLQILKKKGNNNFLSTLIIRNILKKISIELKFYLYSFFVYNIDIKIKRKSRKAKLYYLRKKPKKYSICSYI